MLLAADNDLVQAFATDGPNQALGPPSAIARPPAPVAAKPSAMPPNERLRPDDLEDPNNRWKPAIQLDEEQAVTVGQPRSAPARAP